MVSGLGQMSYEQRLEALGMTTLEQRREDSDMIETFKILSGTSKVDSSNWFACAADSGGGRLTRLTADPLNLRAPAARLELRRNFFSYRVCEKWNAIPSDIKNSANVKSFKNAYRHYKYD